MTHTAEIIAVGTELLLGNIANTDAQEVSQALSGLGINVFFHTVVGDNPERVKQAVAIAKDRADIIITTGGLGPTCDDLTKQTLAEAFGKKLIFSEEEAESIREFFRARGSLEMTENNMQQALLPEGCTVFHNGCGTAPGCAFEAEGKHVIMLPGPPKECRAMLHSGAVPYLKSLSESEIHSHNIRITGMGESSVEARLRDMMLEMQNPTLAPYAKEGEVLLRLTAKAQSKEQAEKMMAPVLEKIKNMFGDLIYGIDVDSLESAIIEMLAQKGKTLALAESCTGGLIAKRLTDVAGASKVFCGCAVTYSVESKSELLGVDKALLDKEGAVCEEVARQMAKGAAEKFGADIGLGVTGVAGPGPDERGIPAGTVYISIYEAGETKTKKLEVELDRDRVRSVAAGTALDMIRRQVCGLEI